MQKYDYLIVGSGFFGATFAQLMNSYGKKCLVIESNDHVGGLSATKRLENIDVHLYGPHIFHTSKQEVWDYVLKFAAFNNFINAPLAITGGHYADGL